MTDKDIIKLLVGAAIGLVAWVVGTFFYDYIRDNRDSIQGLIDLHMRQ